jgi:hypothetical protein
MRVQVAAVCFAFVCSVSARSQLALPSAPEPFANWRSVETLPPSAPVYLKTTTRHLSCRVQSVEQESVHCGSAADSVIQRSEIQSIKRAHRGRSLLAGVALGAGVGAIVGAALGPKSCTANTLCFDFINRADTAAFGAVFFGIVGAPVGYFTDFTRSTVYKTR